MKHRKVLFICSGTECSGIMAAALFQKILGEKMGDGVDEIQASYSNVSKLHKGVSSFAKFVMEERGIFLSNHNSLPLSKDTIEAHDLVLAMNRDIKEEIVRKFPVAREKIYTVKEFSGLPEGKGIPDPTGMGLEVYYDCALYLGVCAERIIERYFVSKEREDDI